MPSSRASAISAVLSMVNVTSPSTSAGRSPASASAASVASAASRSSLRPESLENSVAPIPAIAAARRSRRACFPRPRAALHAPALRQADPTVPVTWSPRPHRPMTSTAHSWPPMRTTRPENVSVSPA